MCRALCFDVKQQQDEGWLIDLCVIQPADEPQRDMPTTLMINTGEPSMSALSSHASSVDLLTDAVRGRSSVMIDS